MKKSLNDSINLNVVGKWERVKFVYKYIFFQIIYYYISIIIIIIYYTYSIINFIIIIIIHKF